MSSVQSTRPTRREVFFQGVIDTSPMIIGAVPFGILFGALSVNAGLSPSVAVGMSLFVFAGSAQFVAASLLSQGAGVAIIVLTTFVVNLRHALYSASLSPYLAHLPQRWLVPLGFALTDETYAIVIKRYRGSDRSQRDHWYFFGSAFAMYLNWQVCTLLGIYAGQRLQGLAEWGLEFALVVTFIGIVVPMLTDKPMVITALSAVAISLLARDMPHNSGLIVASLCAIVIGVLADSWQQEQ